MNENIDLTKILKNCPEGTVLWSDNYGEVQFKCISKSYNYHISYPILVKRADGHNLYYTKEGWHDIYFPSNCLLWPSKDCRDWSKFTAPWYRKEKFDPKTLKPFDKVLVRDSYYDSWKCMLFSHIIKNERFSYVCGGHPFAYCIPYNEETKHLVGTKEEAPDFYKW